MVTLSSVVAWKIPWAEEPGGLGSMGLQRVRPDRDKHTLPALGTLSFSHWTTGDVPTVFIYPTSESETVTQHHGLNGHDFVQTLGESEGQRSLVCCSTWSPKKSDTT